jgi:cytochrome c-type biogenesis protein
VDGENVNILIAFTAGVLSFVSPCVLPLVPVYVAHIAEVTVDGRRGAHQQLLPALHAVSFVAGFTLVFVGFWAGIGLLGFALKDNAQYLRQAGGVVLIFMGFHLIGIINLGFLNQERVFNGRVRIRSGFLKSFVLGLIFAAGWTPCVGPVLGAIIGLATFGGESTKGTLLLVAYSLGLGLPFIAAALAVDKVTLPLKRARRLRVAVPIVSGVLVAAIGFLMLTNMLVQMPQYFDWGGGAIG